ncbi:MAG: hypothetical protein NTV34_01675 [Proteobacteria bacterium]|nr:hypothetical protein [Pseudomonadota bacterium]
MLSGQGVVMFGTLYICFLSYRMLVNTVHSLADWNQDTLFIAGGIAFMLYQAGIMGYGIVHLIDHRFTRGIYRFAAILPIELIGEGGKCGVGLTYNITPHGYALMIPKSFGAKRGDLIKFRLRIPSGDIFGLLNVRWSKPIKSSNRPYDSFGVQVVQHENNLHYLAMMHFCYIFLARRYPSPENPIISNEISIQNDGGVYYMPKHDHRKIEVSTETNESLFEFAEESTDITIPTQNGNAA